MGNIDSSLRYQEKTLERRKAESVKRQVAELQSICETRQRTVSIVTITSSIISGMETGIIQHATAIVWLAAGQRTGKQEIHAGPL